MAACLPEGMQAAPGVGTTGGELGSSTSGTGLSGAEPSGTESSSSGLGFLPRPDVGGSIFACDIWAHDCPTGEKCMPYAAGGGGAWSGTRCSPIAADPGGVGEACLVDGSGVSGLDDCDLATMCWDVDPETNEGTCVPLCVGSASGPLCEDPNRHCVQASGGALNLCLPLCDPLLQDCPEGQACYGTIALFACAPDASGDRGGLNDACEFHNVCDPGFQCMSADGHPCEPGASACCRPFCRLGDVATCSAIEECVPWFEDDAAPARFEDVGYCAFPDL